MREGVDALKRFCTFLKYFEVASIDINPVSLLASHFL